MLVRQSCALAGFLVSGMEPTADEITTLGLDKSLKAIATWAGMDAALVKAWGALLGFDDGELERAHPRLLASLSKEEYFQTLAAWKVGEPAAPATPMQLMKARAIYSGVQAACKASPLVETRQGPSKEEVENALVALAKSAAGGSQKEVRCVKMSSLIDPCDESAVPAASENQLKVWYSNYKALKHGDPLVEKDHTPDQISAMHTKIVLLKLEPYADFSLLTPHGRRMAKCSRHRSWVPQEDGTYRPVMVPSKLGNLASRSTK